jgi:hypothetical protein
MISSVEDKKVLSFLKKRYNIVVANASDYGSQSEAGRKIKEILTRSSPPEQVGVVGEKDLLERTETFLTEGLVPEGKDRLSEEEETYLLAAQFTRQMVGELDSTPIPPQAESLSIEDQLKIRFQFYVANNLGPFWGIPKKNWIVAYNAFRQGPMHYLDLGLRAA